MVDARPHLTPKQVIESMTPVSSTADFVEHNLNRVVDVSNGATLYAANYVVLDSTSNGNTVTV